MGTEPGPASSTDSAPTTARWCGRRQQRLVAPLPDHATLRATTGTLCSVNTPPRATGSRTIPTQTHLTNSTKSNCKLLGRKTSDCITIALNLITIIRTTKNIALSLGCISTDDYFKFNLK